MGNYVCILKRKDLLVFFIGGFAPPRFRKAKGSVGRLELPARLGNNGTPNG